MHSPCSHPTSKTTAAGYLEEGLCLTLVNSSLGSHRGQSLVSPFSLSYHSYADDKQLTSPWSDTQVCTHLCVSGDISQWMSAHHLKLNLNETELLIIPVKDSPIYYLSINIGTSVVSQRRQRILWPRLFSSHIATIATPSWLDKKLWEKV